MKLQEVDGYPLFYRGGEAGALVHLLFPEGPCESLCGKGGNWHPVEFVPKPGMICQACLDYVKVQCYHRAWAPTGRCRWLGAFESVDFPGLLWCRDHKGPNDKPYHRTGALSRRRPPLTSDQVNESLNYVQTTPKAPPLIAWRE